MGYALGRWAFGGLLMWLLWGWKFGLIRTSLKCWGWMHFEYKYAGCVVILPYIPRWGNPISDQNSSKIIPFAHTSIVKVQDSYLPLIATDNIMTGLKIFTYASWQCLYFMTNVTKNLNFVCLKTPSFKELSRSSSHSTMTWKNIRLLRLRNDACYSRPWKCLYERAIFLFASAVCIKLILYTVASETKLVKQQRSC